MEHIRIFSRFGRNLTPVLATILLLSYTKLLQVIVTVLSFTHLDYPDGSRVVWLYDGNITFGRGNHLPLFIVSLIILVIGVLPYTALLVLFPLTINIVCCKSKLVRSLKSPNPLKNYIDVYLNPYKVHPHCGIYWPALLLVTRAFHIILFASILGDPGVNLFAVTATAFLLTILNLAVGGVYKSRLLTITVLETSYLLNIGVLSASTALSSLLGVNHAAVVYLSIVFAVITFASAYTKFYQGLIARATNGYKAWCSKPLDRDRENSTVVDLEHNLRDLSNSGQPKLPVTTTIIEGVPKEEDDDDTAEQQAEASL